MDKENIPSHEGYSCIKQATSTYKYPDEAKKDVLNIFESYKDLRPKLERYVFNDGSTKNLLSLNGTIPIDYRGSSYNIPVCLWVMDTHPYSPPMAYVRPSRTMRIMRGKLVNGNGRIELPYLHEWIYPEYDLLGFIHTLCAVFGDDPPITTVLSEHKLRIAVPLRDPRSKPDQVTRPLGNSSSSQAGHQPRGEGMIISPSHSPRRDSSPKFDSRNSHPRRDDKNTPTSDAFSHLHLGVRLPVEQGDRQRSDICHRSSADRGIWPDVVIRGQTNAPWPPATVTEIMVDKRMSSRSCLQQNNHRPAGQTKDLVQRKMREQYIDRLLSEQYANRERVQKDVADLTDTYKHLKLRLECVDEESEKNLLVLEGSILVSNGVDAITHVEVMVWVPDDYPWEEPLVYLLSPTPFPEKLMIDNIGKLNLPYTTQWKEDRNLLGMFAALSECL